jgi:hypothetical protein
MKTKHRKPINQSFSLIGAACKIGGAARANGLCALLLTVLAVQAALAQVPDNHHVLAAKVFYSNGEFSSVTTNGTITPGQVQVLRESIDDEYTYRLYSYELLEEVPMVLRRYAVSSNAALDGEYISPYVDGVATNFVHREHVYTMYWDLETNIFCTQPFSNTDLYWYLLISGFDVEPSANTPTPTPSPQGNPKPAGGGTQTTYTVIGTVTIVYGWDTVALSCQRDGSVLTLSWPSWAGAFHLEFTDSLTSPNWQTQTNGIADNGTNKTYSITLPTEVPSRFFRLSQ